MLRLTQVRNTVVNIQEMKEYCLYKQILPKRYIRERLLDREGNQEKTGETGKRTDGYCSHIIVDVRLKQLWEQRWENYM